MTDTHPPTAGVAPLLRLDVGAVRESVGLVRHVVGGLADHATIGRPMLTQVLLGVSEAVTQAVIGARPADRVDVQVWLTGDGSLRVVVTDARAHGVTGPQERLARSTIVAVTATAEFRSSASGGTEVEMWFASSSAGDGQSSRLL